MNKLLFSLILASSTCFAAEITTEIAANLIEQTTVKTIKQEEPSFTTKIKNGLKTYFIRNTKTKTAMNITKKTVAVTSLGIPLYFLNMNPFFKYLDNYKENLDRIPKWHLRWMLISISFHAVTELINY